MKQWHELTDDSRTLALLIVEASARECAEYAHRTRLSGSECTTAAAEAEALTALAAFARRGAALERVEEAARALDRWKTNPSEWIPEQPTAIGGRVAVNEESVVGLLSDVAQLQAALGELEALDAMGGGEE